MTGLLEHAVHGAQWSAAAHLLGLRVTPVGKIGSNADGSPPRRRPRPARMPQLMSSVVDQAAIRLLDVALAAALRRTGVLDLVGRRERGVGMFQARHGFSGTQVNTTVLWPFISTRCSTCQRPPRAVEHHALHVAADRG
jgi:hypothetical protein